MLGFDGDMQARQWNFRQHWQLTSGHHEFRNLQPSSEEMSVRTHSNSSISCPWVRTAQFVDGLGVDTISKSQNRNNRSCPGSEETGSLEEESVDRDRWGWMFIFALSLIYRQLWLESLGAMPPRLHSHGYQRHLTLTLKRNGRLPNKTPRCRRQPAPPLPIIRLWYPRSV